MSDTVAVTYVGIHDEVHIPALDDLTVERGQTVDVSAEAAGRAPKGDPSDEDYDAGYGLLAQPDNWQHVPAKPETPAAKKARLAAEKKAADEAAQLEADRAAAEEARLRGETP